MALGTTVYFCGDIYVLVLVFPENLSVASIVIIWDWLSARFPHVVKSITSSMSVSGQRSFMVLTISVSLFRNVYAGSISGSDSPVPDAEEALFSLNDLMQKSEGKFRFTKQARKPRRCCWRRHRCS